MVSCRHDSPQPHRQPSVGGFVGDEYGIKDYVSEVVIPPGSFLVGQTLRSSEINGNLTLTSSKSFEMTSILPSP